MKKFYLLMIALSFVNAFFLTQTALCGEYLDIGDIRIEDRSGLYCYIPLGEYVQFRFGTDIKNRFYMRHDGNDTCLRSYKGGFKFLNTVYTMDIKPRHNNTYALGTPSFRFTSLWLTGSVHCSNGDVAEFFSTSGWTLIKPGDVVEIDPEEEGSLRLCETANSRLVAGVCSTDPGIKLGEENYRSAFDIPLALSGTVPCNVTDEGGIIMPGDLLTSSSTPGHAMKFDFKKHSETGTIIGKALEKHESGKGKIKILVFLR